MNEIKKIGLLYGGRSKEADVSYKSVDNVEKALLNLRYEVVKLECSTRDDIKKIVNSDVDLMFNCVMGEFGEDGCLSGLCELLDIPYTHSGVLASALGMNKFVASQYLGRFGINVTKQKIVEVKDLDKEIEINSPSVLKPVSGGSSNNLVFIDKPGKYIPKELGFEIDTLIEDYLEGEELSVAVLKDKVLGIVKIKNDNKVFTREMKYINANNEVELEIPAKLDSDIEEYCKEQALKIHKLMDCKTISRIDFKYDSSKGKDGLVVLELNTVPAFTSKSLYPKIANIVSGLSWEQLLEEIIEDAIKEYNNK